MQDPKNRQKPPSEHYCTTFSGYIFATKARIDNRKKQQCLSHTPSEYGELRLISG